MTEQRHRPVVLTIAGSDSGGGAGIQADLKAIVAMGGWAATAITCLTAQNLEGVRSVQPTEPTVLGDQIDAVFEGFEVRAVKTGMLFAAELIRVVIDRLDRRGDVPLVIDPVMVATSGARLLQEDAIETLRSELLPKAVLITPNLHEAALLTGFEVSDPPSMARAAERLFELGAEAALVKGGHLDGDAVDVLFDGTRVHEYRSRRVAAGRAAHGTGCSLASAIATGLARGMSLPDAVEVSKRRVTRALQDATDIGGGIEALDLFSATPHRSVVHTLH